MADKSAWNSWKQMNEFFKNLQKCIDDFKALAERLEVFKMGVMDNPVRLAELKKIIDEDPNWTIESIQAKYNEIKAIYDYLIDLRG